MIRFSCSQLRAAGKEAFFTNRSEYVLMGVIFTVACAVATLIAKAGCNVYSLDSGHFLGDVGNNVAIAVNFGLDGLVSSAATAMLVAPIQVGMWRFCLRTARGEEKSSAVECAKSGFLVRYADTVVATLMVEYETFLWSLLFLIPGMVKSYSYRLVPALLADNGDMKPEEALATSEYLMKGNRMNAFLLDLSFIGWAILSGLTFGILGILFVVPYKLATDAEFYRSVVEHQVSKRI